jgi:hypothetical protein
MKDRNADSMESMLRSDRANITIKEKYNSAKKYFSHSRKNGKLFF